MKLQSDQRLKGAAIALFSSLALTACGGGGGGGSTPVSPPPPPPPPPPVNVAPTAQATATPSAPQEGQPFTLDASGSSDPEGATLAYSWSQVSGPAVTLTAPNQATLELAAAEVTEDADAVFRVSVSDGTNTSTADVTVTFANIAQTPLFVDMGTPILTTTLSDTPLSVSGFQAISPLVVTEATPGGRRNLSELIHDTADNVLQLRAAFDGTISADAELWIVAHTFTLTPRVNVGRLAVIETNEDQVRFLKINETGEALEEDFVIDAEKPCSIIMSNLESGGDILRRYHIGQKDFGFSIFEAGVLSDPNTEISFLARNQNNQSLCAMIDTPTSYDGHIFDSTLTFPRKIVFNETTSSFETYMSNRNGPGPDLDAGYFLTSSAPVQTNATHPLRLVQTYRVNSYVGGPSLLSIYTDDEREGEHRLVVASVDATSAVVQSTHSWSLGVPESIVAFDMNGDQTLEVIIVAKDSPQAVVFTQSETPTAQNPLGLSEPQYLEIGLGASSIWPVQFPPAIPAAFAVSYPDQKEIRLFARE